MLEIFRGQRVWMVPLLAALLVGFVGWWANQQVRSVIERGLREDLQSTLDANVTALEIWMANQKRISSALVEEPRLHSLALELLDSPDAGGTNRFELSRQLVSGEHLAERLRTLGYGLAQLVNTNMVVVADTSRGRARLGSTVMEELQSKYNELFESGEPIVITPFKLGGLRSRRLRGPRSFTSPERPDDYQQPPRLSGRERPRNPAFWGRDRPRFRDLAVMQVAAPVKDDAGTTRGALALAINPDAEFSRILSVARTGESGETFAFDSEGLLISESRFDETLRRVGLLEDNADARSALNLYLRDPGGDLTRGYRPDTNATLPLIKMVNLGLVGISGVELNPFRDYRGVEVVGAWRWLPAYGFGVGTKIDASEAYRTARVVQRVFMILFLLLVLSSIVILLFSYMQMVWRRRVSEAELKARQLGQYRLQEKIGEGGMGIVYRAQHALLRRETALKMLPPTKADPDAVQRFEQEVRLTCRLAHPNTIQVYDYGHTPDGIFYYAMEFLDGLHLRTLVEQFGPQPGSRVIHILRQVCDSLSEAHALGLIHRDIKPANVFLTDRGGVPDNVKVLDFGLVKRAGGNGDSTVGVKPVREEGMIGTPQFIAPESLRDPAHTETRSDLYAVGALGYYLLSGFHVFPAANIAEACEKHLKETPIPPSARLGRPLSPQLEEVILACLAKAPSDRPSSASELARRLAACPEAEEWTLERRASWWTEYRRTSATVVPRVPSATLTEATVKIELGERMP